MKSYKNLFPKLCSYNNLYKAYRKARKNKGSMPYVIEFEKNLKTNLLNLKRELECFEYKPFPLVKFVIRDPKTRVIRKSKFGDRVIHHSIVNILEPIYEKIFIYDSYANRVDKGTLSAIKRFDKFKRKASKNGRLINNAKNKTTIKGYVLKADIKHFFDSVNHEILIKILKRKIKDKKILRLINLILQNFDNKEKGMPLGNMTSQFFANIYLNELDYFIKHKLKTKYYIRYVDDFVILHNLKEQLIKWKEKINQFLNKEIKLQLHPEKSQIFSLYKGIKFLGYRIYYYHKLLRKTNLKNFERKFNIKLRLYKQDKLTQEDLLKSLQGWFGYAMWANTYKLRKGIVKELNYVMKRFKGNVKF